MTLQLPTVTIDDLRQFHAKHFAHAPLPTNYLHGAVTDAVQEGYTYEDEDLGYYEDGAERTLTDEEIAILRHTEIQTILRERRRRLEEGKPLHAAPTPPSPSANPDVFARREPTASASPSPTQNASESIASGADKVQSGRVEKPKQKWTAISEKSRARNAKNRQKNRKNHRARKKEEQKRKEQEMLNAEESDEWDPWHQANGPDVQNDPTVDLDY